MMKDSEKQKDENVDKEWQITINNNMGVEKAYWKH
jgi:hypothetical protein